MSSGNGVGLNDVSLQDEDEGAEVLEPIPELERERDFMAAEAFDGSREGYVFKMGGFGLGEQRITVPVKSCMWGDGTMLAILIICMPVQVITVIT